MTKKLHPKVKRERAAARKAATNAANAVIAAAAQEGVGGHYGGGSSIVEIPGKQCGLILDFDTTSLLARIPQRIS